MGLDQYLYAINKKYVTYNTDGEILFSENRELEELHYWRKHPNLQGWMENLHRVKYPNFSGSYNCEFTELLGEDLDRLTDNVKNNKLPETQGFFFGYSSLDTDEINYDLIAIEKARQALENDYIVIYYSWW